MDQNISIRQQQRLFMQNDSPNHNDHDFPISEYTIVCSEINK